MHNNIEIITINYNTPHLVERLIQSIRHIEGDYPIRIIDGSDAEPFQTQIKEVCAKFSNVTLEPQGWNIHHGRGMDLGVSTSKYEWCFIIDSDNYLQRPILDVMVAATAGGKKIVGGAVPNYSRGNVEMVYYHPSLMLFNTAYYLELKQKGVKFEHDGAPCYAIMKYLHDNNLSSTIGVDLWEFMKLSKEEIWSYTNVHNQGTADIFGYNFHTRIDVINLLFDTYKYTTYLEIGVGDPNNNFNRIKAPIKHSVDPNPLGSCTYKTTSDDFFANLISDKKYDVIFVDGLHTKEQAYKDVKNAIDHLSDGGFIVMHDCNPAIKFFARTYEEFLKEGGAWCGDVYKAFIKLKQELPTWSCFVVNENFGCGILTPKAVLPNNPITCDPDNISWEYFEQNRKELLQLVHFATYRDTIIK